MSADLKGFTIATIEEAVFQETIPQKVVFLEEALWTSYLLMEYEKNSDD